MKFQEGLLFVGLGALALFLILTVAGDPFLTKRGGTIEKTLESDGVLMSIVSRTEYVPDDDGQVIVELRDKQYAPINASCLSSILYPNKTYFFQDELMIGSVLGTEYMNFTVPLVDGVFEYSVNCTYNAKSYVLGSSFHVSKGRLRAWIEK